MNAIDLSGRKGLVVGIANEHSLGWAAARRFCGAGAELAMTYYNEKARARIEPLARQLDARLFLPCDVAAAGEIEALFGEIERAWGRLDFVLHSVAWARKDALHRRLIDCPAELFGESMLVSCHSFIRMARLAEALMPQGGSLTTMTYYGAEKVVEHYDVMGPVKAALEASVRYLAHELGPKGIRVNAISAGAVRTRAAGGIEHFEELLAEAERRAPLRRAIDPDEVGRIAAVLASEHAAAITGEIVHVDAGFHIEGMAFH